MRKFALILLVCTALAACPFESTVPLAPAPTEAVDSTLMGYWYGIVKDGSDFFGIEALDISKQSDSVYAITRYGKAVKGDIILPDTAYFTGYTTQIGDQRFMIVEGSVLIVTPKRKGPPDIQQQKVFYTSSLELHSDTLKIKTVTENFSPTIKNFKTPHDFNRMLSEALSQHKNIFDDLYSLSYRKSTRPAAMKAF